MLSRAQKKFLADARSFSKKYARQQRYAIRKKVDDAMGDLLLVMNNKEVLGLDLDVIRPSLEEMTSIAGKAEPGKTMAPSRKTKTQANPFASANSGWGK